MLRNPLPQILNLSRESIELCLEDLELCSRVADVVASFREGWAREEKVERTSGLVNLNALVEKVSREVGKVLL